MDFNITCSNYFINIIEIHNSMAKCYTQKLNFKSLTLLILIALLVLLLKYKTKK